MKKKILAFGASNSKNSLNKTFADFASRKVLNADVNLLDLNDFEMPIYSVDREKETGIHEKAFSFKSLIKDCDGLVISMAEHNGAYTAAFKNIFDWVSRIDKNVWDDKPILLLSTSPGDRGGKSVIQMAESRFQRMSKGTIYSFSLPSFRQNFLIDRGIITDDLNDRFHEALGKFEKSLITP